MDVQKQIDWSTEATRNHLRACGLERSDQELCLLLARRGRQIDVAEEVCFELTIGRAEAAREMGVAAASVSYAAERLRDHYGVLLTRPGRTRNQPTTYLLRCARVSELVQQVEVDWGTSIAEPDDVRNDDDAGRDEASGASDGPGSSGEETGAMTHPARQLVSAGQRWSEVVRGGQRWSAPPVSVERESLDSVVLPVSVSTGAAPLTSADQRPIGRTVGADDGRSTTRQRESGSAISNRKSQIANSIRPWQTLVALRYPWGRDDGVTGEELRWAVRHALTDGSGGLKVLRRLYDEACVLEWVADCEDSRLRFLTLAHHCATSPGINSPMAVLVARVKKQLLVGRVRHECEDWAAKVIREARRRSSQIQMANAQG